jgi:hypothetical protein
MKDWFKIIVADQHHFDGDPDPADQFDADLDSAATFMRAGSGSYLLIRCGSMRIRNNVKNRDDFGLDSYKGQNE